MNRIIKKTLVLLIAIALFLPALSSIAFADEELTSADIWNLKFSTSGYQSDAFNSLESRLRGNEVIGAMNLVLVKDGMALYNDSYSGEVIVLKLVKGAEGDDVDENGYKFIDKENKIYAYNSYWASNPVDIGSSKQSDSDSATNANIKKNLYSQLIVKFTEESSEKTFYSFSDSSQYEQITTKGIKGGLRVEYVIGRLSVKYLVPEVVTLERWFEIYKMIRENSKNEANRFAAFYDLRVADLNDPIVKEIGAVMSFPIKALTDQQKKDYPVSLQSGLAVCTSNISEKERKDVEVWVSSTGYTFEQLEEDHSQTGYQSTDVESPVFRLALEYTLNSNGLSVRCNAANVRFDTEKYSLSNIYLLPFAGAGNIKNDGYILSPDGCGTIYSFNNIKNSAMASSEKVYGQDFAFSTITGENREQIRIPVFGVIENTLVANSGSSNNESTEETVSSEDAESPVEGETSEEAETSKETESSEGGEVSEETESSEDSEVSKETESSEDSETSEEADDVVSDETKYVKHGYLAIIEEGDSLANIVIERQGSFHSYVQTYTTFNPRPKDTYALNGGISAGANALWTVEADRKYTGDFRIRIILLSEEDSSYVGMAKKFREYLYEKEILKPITDESEDIPLYLETVGAIDSTDRFMGVPYEIKQELTTYENAKDILKQLKEEGKISNINLKLTGWVNGGINSLVPSGIELVEELGGKSGFEELVKYCDENGFQLFPEFEFSYATEDEMFDDFKPKKHLAKTIDNRNAYKKEYDALMQTFHYTRKGIISTNSMPYFYELTQKDFEKYGIKNISVSTLGSDLSSDFNKDDPLNREDSKKNMRQLLEKMNADTEEIMVSGGNLFVWDYVDHILNLPLENTMHLSATASVPFLSFVLHGSIEYSGSPINLAGDYETYLLKTIENGASPYFVVAFENASELKANNVLTEFYSVRYSILKQNIVDTYGEINKVLKNTKHMYMNSHSYIDDLYKVVKVGYASKIDANYSDNEFVYYLNYNDEAYTFTENGKEYTIDSYGYILVDANGNIVE